jgi:hypothetical protein
MTFGEMSRAAHSHAQHRRPGSTWHALTTAGTVVGMAKERMSKEQRKQERERQQQERIDAWVERAVAEAPPLTPEQRAKRWVLLEPARRKLAEDRRR